MYNGNVQQNPLCVESFAVCVTKEFAISPRFTPTIFDPDANSVLLRAHPCTAVYSMRRNPVFEIVQESVKVCTTGMSSRTLYAQHPLSLRIFRSLPGSRLRFSSPGKSSTLQCTVFDTLQPKLMHPADYYVRNIKLKKCVIVLHSTGTLSRVYSSSTFYAQNPALEIFDQQEERECLSTRTCTK